MIEDDRMARSEKVREVVEDFIARRASGKQPRMEEVLAQHADLLPELADEFDRLQRLGSSLLDQTAIGVISIRCPQCGEPYETDCDAPWSDLQCEACGAEFSLGAQANKTNDVIGQLGHFEILGRLGLGSFGTVWKARDPKLDRTVAIKVPRQHFPSDIEVEQFFREARAAAQLRHPNIVAVHEIGRAQDELFIVSDYVPGVSLDQWLDQEKRSITEVVTLMRTLVLAVHHAHQAGVIHRDLKPTNIMVDANHQPHVLDFGLAKRLASDATLTVDGQLLGTPAYMSPEQAKGEGNRSDHRTDLYSLGVIFFFLLTRNLPFRGDLQMTMRQVIEDDPPSLRQLNHQVPWDLETICLKCLEKEPAKRFASGQELADELDRYLKQLPIRTRRVGFAGRSLRWVKRNPAITALLGAILVAVAAGASVSTVFAMRASTSAGEANAMFLGTARVAGVVVDQLKRELRLVEADLEHYRAFYDLRWKQLEQIVNTDPRRAREELDAVPGVYRDERWHLLDRQLNEQTELPIVLDTGSEGVRGAQWSADGDLAVVWKEDRVRLYRRSQEQPIFDLSVERTTECRFSPDGSELLIVGADRHADMIQVATGQSRGSLPHADVIVDAAFSPDGQILATASADHQVNLWDLKTLEQIATKYNYRHNYVASLAFAPDSKLLVSGGGRQLRQWNVPRRTAVLVPFAVALDHDIRFLQVSPTGQQVLVATETETWLSPIPGASPRKGKPLRIDDILVSACFGGDGTKVFAVNANNELWVWRTDNAERLGKLAAFASPPMDLKYFEPQQQLGVALGDGTLRVLTLK